MSDESEGDGWELTVTIAPPPLAHVLKVINEEFAGRWPPEERAAFRRGLKAILEPSAGRPPCDDQAALADVQEMLAAGRVKSIREACLAVAKVRADGADIDTMAERLRKKMRKFGAKKY